MSEPTIADTMQIYAAVAAFLGTWLEQKSDPNPHKMSDNLQALPATWETFVDELDTVAFDKIWHFLASYDLPYGRIQANGQVTWGNLP